MRKEQKKGKDTKQLGMGKKETMICKKKKKKKLFTRRCSSHFCKIDLSKMLILVTALPT